MAEESFEKLKGDLDEFASKYIGATNQFVYFKSGKIIHDAIWGTHFFEPYELSIISLPIFQRLRQVSQMGFVNYIYPSARHTRFEHSLGVTIVADKLFQYAQKGRDELLNKNDLRHIRIAGLLHDIGHGLFSHTSEEVYGYMLDEFIETEFEGKNVNPKAHEFLSYLLIKTIPFQQFFQWLNKEYDLSVDLARIADIIVGLPQSEDSRYKVSFINGSFDADKLDYFYRDSRFSGIPVQLDLDRLFNVMDISNLSEVSCDSSGGPIQDLTIGLSGVTCLEQIVFNKMILFSTIYHHQKVKACDCMFKGVLEYIKKNKLEIQFKEKKCNFNNPIDYITLTDIDFFAEGARTEDELLHKLIHNILYRRILKRALVISKRTIENGDLNQLLSTRVNKHQKDQELREVAKEITERAGNPCTYHEVWIDIPKAPSFKEAATTYVRTKKNNPSEDLQRLEEFFPIKQWEENYEMHKLKGHIFCPEDCLDSILSAAKKVFLDKYEISFKEDAIVNN